MAGVHCLISRTGYTGEDGFELYHAASDAPALAEALLVAGAPHGLERVPVAVHVADDGDGGAHAHLQ